MSKLEVISFNKQIFHAVSLSGGKDSTAMLLLMIERGLPMQAEVFDPSKKQRRPCALKTTAVFTPACTQREIRWNIL